MWSFSSSVQTRNSDEKNDKKSDFSVSSKPKTKKNSSNLLVKEDQDNLSKDSTVFLIRLMS